MQEVIVHETLTAHAVPEVKTWKTRNSFHWCHDSVDDGKYATDHAEYNCYGDTEDCEEPQAKGHEGRISQEFFFYFGPVEQSAVELCPSAF